MDSNIPNRKSDFYINNDTNNSNDRSSVIELPTKNDENILSPKNEEKIRSYNTMFDEDRNSIQTPTANNNNFTNILFKPNPSKFNEPLVTQEGGASCPPANSAPVMEPIGSEITQDVIRRKNFKIFSFFMAYHSFFLIFAIPLIVLVFGICSRLKYSEHLYFKRIHDNWTKSPISKITTETCEAFDQQLIQNYWPGTTSGCDCYTYIKFICSKKNRCRKIKALDPIAISFWRGKRLCRESSAAYQNKNYFDLNIEKSAENCSTGTRSCGIIDTLGSHLCVESSTPCPLNSLNFYNVTEYDKIKDSIPKDNLAIQLSNGYLVYGNNPKNEDLSTLRIPIEYKISNAQPCLNPFYENMNFPIYLLEVHKGRQECLKYADNSDNSNEDSTSSTTDPIKKDYYFNTDYAPLDTISQKVLYTENGITAKTYNLPLFPKTQYNHEIMLYATNYFGLNPSCYKDIKRGGSADEVLADLSKVSEIVSINLSLLKIYNTIFIVIIFLMLFLGTTIISKPKGRRLLRKVDSANVIFYGCFSCFAEILVILLLINLINIQGKLGIGDDFVKVFSDSSCVDKFTIDLYNQLVPDILYAKSAANWGIFLAIVIMAHYVLFYIIGKKYTNKGDAIYSDD